MQCKAGKAVLLVALLAGAGAAWAQADAPDQGERGLRTYQAFCSSCHGVAAKGDGPAAKQLVQPPADLTQLAKRHGGVFPSLRVADSIDGRSASKVNAHGPREMPVWGWVFRAAPPPGNPAPFDPDHLARQRRVDLLEYLARIQEK